MKGGRNLQRYAAGGTPGLGFCVAQAARTFVRKAGSYMALTFALCGKSKQKRIFIARLTPLCGGNFLPKISESGLFADPVREVNGSRACGRADLVSYGWWLPPASRRRHLFSIIYYLKKDESKDSSFFIRASTALCEVPPRAPWLFCPLRQTCGLPPLPKGEAR